MKVLIVFAACCALALGSQQPLATPVRPMDITPFEGRIVNGSPAGTNQFPWQASIRASNTAGQQSICGGSIISNQWVLTAAHCIRGFVSFQLGFGSNSLNGPVISMTSTNRIEHPNYNPNTLNNDIALIGMPSTLSFSAGIQAIRLPTASQATATFANQQAAVSGFGRTVDGGQVSNTLNWTNLRVITNADCQTTFGSSLIIASTICARGWDSNFQSTCNGDSGGPMVINEGGTWTQVGVVSFVSSRGCAAGDPSGYVRTASFLTWISQNSGIAVRP